LVFCAHPFFASCAIDDIGDSISKIKPYKSHISIATHLTQINLNTTLLSQENRGKIEYKTATATRFGLAFDYKWVGIELFTRLPFNEHKEKGTTKNSGLYLRINKSKFWANVIMQRFTGFYWSNPDASTRLELKPGYYPINPSMRSNLIHVSAYYIFQPDKFSNMAAQGENARQLRSGGSFFAGLGFYFDNLISTVPIVPPGQVNNFKSQDQLVQILARSFALNGGYAHTFVIFKKICTTLYLAPGLAFFNGKKTFLDDEKVAYKGQFTLRLDSRISIGYNSDNYFGGFLLSNSTNNQNLGTGTSYSYGFSTVRFYVGKRFALKKSLGVFGL